MRHARQENPDLDNKKEIEKLITEARAGHQRAFSELVLQYTPLIESECLKRADKLDLPDLKQAALIGLYSAVCSYDFSRGVTFGAYARVCVSNRLDSELRRAPRKDESLDEALSRETGLSPEEEIIARERLAQRLAHIDSLLSDYERQVFKLYLGGESYKFIAARLGKSEKSVDGAIRRAKEKLRRAFSETLD